MALTAFQISRLLTLHKLNLPAEEFGRQLAAFELRYRQAVAAEPEAQRAQAQRQELTRLFESLSRVEKQVEDLTPELRKHVDKALTPAWRADLLTAIGTTKHLFTQIEWSDSKPQARGRVQIEEEIIQWLAHSYQRGSGQRATVVFQGGTWKSPFFTFANECMHEMGLPTEGLGSRLSKLL